MKYINAEVSYYIDHRKAEPTFHVLVYPTNTQQRVFIHDLTRSEFYLAVGLFKLVPVELINDNTQEVFGLPWQSKLPASK